MPWSDWQFWLVTLASVWGLWALVRQLLPKRRSDGVVACSSCSVGTAGRLDRPARQDSRRQDTARATADGSFGTD